MIANPPQRGSAIRVTRRRAAYVPFLAAIALGGGTIVLVLEPSPGVLIVVASLTIALCALLGAHALRSRITLTAESIETRCTFARRTVALADIHDVHLLALRDQFGHVALLRGRAGSALLRINGWESFWARTDVQATFAGAGVPVVAVTGTLSVAELDVLAEGASTWAERHPVSLTLWSTQGPLWAFVVAALIAAALDRSPDLPSGASTLLGPGAPAELIGLLKGMHFAVFTSAFTLYIIGAPAWYRVPTPPSRVDLLHRATWRPATAMAISGAAMGALAATSPTMALLATAALVPALLVFRWQPDHPQPIKLARRDGARTSDRRALDPAVLVARSPTHCSYRGRRGLLFLTCLVLQFWPMLAPVATARAN